MPSSKLIKLHLFICCYYIWLLIICHIPYICVGTCTILDNQPFVMTLAGLQSLPGFVVHRIIALGLLFKCLRVVAVIYLLLISQKSQNISDGT